MFAQDLTFDQIHIDVARNSIDDFNPFHDKHKWKHIRDNPFGGPVVLGFQLACLLEYRIRLFRQQHKETELIRARNLRYSNYQLTFASVVRAGEQVSVEIRNSRHHDGANPMISNRVAVRKATGIVLVGYKRESTVPLFYSEPSDPIPEDLSAVPDRSYLTAGGFFLKRKYMNTGNAKNFLSGSLVDQADYFDELNDKVCFPETFPAALISCALLERAHKEQQDFFRAPMVYSAHQISVDREQVARLRSNDVLHILVSPASSSERSKGLGRLGVNQQVFQCRGLTGGRDWLFCANIYMAFLSDMPMAAVANDRKGGAGSQ